MADEQWHLRFENLAVKHADREVLCGSSGRIDRGQAIWVKGENGTGKSTLLNILAGLRRADRGIVHLGGAPHQRPILVPANPEFMLFPWYTVRQNLNLYSELASGRLRDADPGERSRAKRDSAALLEHLTGEFALSKLLARHPYNLSSGETAKVAVACGLLYSPSTLMLDESFNSIDDETTRRVTAVLDEMCAAQKRISLLIVSHQDGPLGDLADAEWFLEKSGPLVQRSRGAGATDP